MTPVKTNENSACERMDIVGQKEFDFLARRSSGFARGKR
jgi:hypothetical protein